MAETLKIFGEQFTGVTGIKAYKPDGTEVTFIQGWTADDVGTGTYPNNLAVTYTKSTILYAAFFRSNITSFYAPNLYMIDTDAVSDMGDSGNVFYKCTALTTLNLPRLRAMRNRLAAGCSSLTSVYIPRATQIGTYTFHGSALTVCVCESAAAILSYAFENCTSLTTVDINGGNTSTGIADYAFNLASNLDTLILRNYSTVTKLSNIRAFAGTKFASGGTGGTLYVPERMISSYQSATNWSTILGYANNRIVKIEGSQYENAYANGNGLLTYTAVTYERSDGKNLNDSGGYAGNTNYFCTAMIATDNAALRYEFWSAVAINASYVKGQVFDANDNFLGMISILNMGSIYVEADSRSYNRMFIYWDYPTAAKFRFCAYPKTDAATGAYLYKVKEHSAT